MVGGPKADYIEVVVVDVLVDISIEDMSDDIASIEAGAMLSSTGAIVVVVSVVVVVSAGLEQAATDRHRPAAAKIDMDFAKLRMIVIPSH